MLFCVWRTSPWAYPMKTWIKLIEFLPYFGINLAWMLWLIEVEINYNLGLVLFLLPPPPPLQTAAVSAPVVGEVQPPLLQPDRANAKPIALHCAFLHCHNALYCIAHYFAHLKKADSAPVVGEVKPACCSYKPDAQSSRFALNCDTFLLIVSRLASFSSFWNLWITLQTRLKRASQVYGRLTRPVSKLCFAVLHWDDSDWSDRWYWVQMQISLSWNDLDYMFDQMQVSDSVRTVKLMGKINPCSPQLRTIL